MAAPVRHLRWWAGGCAQDRAGRWAVDRALPPGWLAIAALVGQLTGDAWPRALRWRISSAKARAARMADRSVLTASSKPRISSCSMSLSRWGRPSPPPPWDLLGGHDRPTRPDGANPHRLPVTPEGCAKAFMQLAALLHWL